MYKRQGQGGRAEKNPPEPHQHESDKHFQAAGRPTAFFSAEVEFPTVEPVSSTHLDVYKRQSADCEFVVNAGSGTVITAHRRPPPQNGS